MSRIKPLRAFFFAALVFGLAVATADPASAATTAAHRAAAAAPAATGPILDSGSPDAVAGQYIVVLQASAVIGTTTATDVAQSLIATYGGTFSQVDDGFQAFTLNATDAIAGTIAGDSRVDYVDQDQWDEAYAAPPPVQDNPDWGLARINQRVPDLGGDPQYATGSSAGVTIYVVDSGVQIGNPDFGGRASYAYNALTNTVGNAPDCSAGVGHGTAVAAIAAGTVYGVAKQATIKSVKVLDCDASGTIPKGDGTVTDRGLSWILQNATAPAVVNLSLGSKTLNASRADYVNRLVAKGFIVTMAAGNDNVDACTATPGSKTTDKVPLNAIVVGASGLDKTVTPVTDKKWSRSNFGKCLTLFAPGQNVTSLRANGTPATLSVFGTSFATPYVSGAAAILLAANPTLNQDQVKQAIVDDATSPATNGVAELVAGAAQTQSPDLLLHVTPPAQNAVTVDGPAVSQQVPSGAQAVDLTFTGTAGQSVYVNGTADAFNAGISLYDPLGSQLGSGSHADYASGQQETWIKPVNLPRTGTYSIHIVPAAGATGSVSVRVLTFATATATVNGPVVSSTITSTLPGRRVVATFTGTAGQTISVNGTGIAAASTITLYDPKGTQIASTSSYASDAGAVKKWIPATNLSATGTYSLYITPAPGATGTFSLQVLGDAALSATVNGPAVSTTITSAMPGRRVVATFAGTAGQTLLINGTGGPFDSTLTLYDPTGARIARGNSYASDSGAAMTWITPVNLSASGTYTLYVTPAAGGTGTVSLQVLTDAATTATIDGAAVSSTITSSLPGRRIAATFSGTAGKQVYVNGSSGAFNSTVTLVDPKGVQIASGSSFSTDLGLPASWISPTNLTATGTYTLYFTPSAGATGTISFQVIGSFVTASTGVNGLPTSVSIPGSTPGKIMTITFSGSAGSAVSMLGITGAVGGTLAMYDPDGQKVAVGAAVPLYPCPDEQPPGTCPQVLIAPVALPITGTYTVYFTPAAVNTGSVSVWVTGASGTPPLVTTINASATVDGAIVPVTIPTAAAGNRVAVTFSASAGQTVYINNSSNSMSCGNDTYSLVGPNGQIIVPAYSPALRLCNLTNVLTATGLPTTGTYTFYITPDGAQSGTANLQVLSSVPTLPATVDGATVPVSITRTAPGQQQAITFSGTAGQTVYINNSSNSMSCGNDTYSLVGPNGQIIVPAYSPALRLCNLTNVLTATGLPTTGTYTFYITPDGAQSGTANLQVLSKDLAVSATVGGAGVPVTISDTSPGQHVAITFAGTAGHAVFITSTNNSMSCGEDTYSLIGPNGQPVVLNYSPSLYLCNATSLLQPTGLPMTGTYTFYVIPDGAQHGTATVQVHQYGT